MEAYQIPVLNEVQKRREEHIASAFAQLYRILFGSEWGEPLLLDGTREGALVKTSLEESFAKARRANEKNTGSTRLEGMVDGRPV